MYVSELKLKNIKNFHEQAFDFRNDDEEGRLEGFHVIVGGNASGKTTVLRGICLAICGQVQGAILQGTDLSGYLSAQKVMGEVLVRLDARNDRAVTPYKNQPIVVGLRLGYTTVVDFGPILIPANEALTNDDAAWLRLGPAAVRAHDGTPPLFLAAYGPFRRLTGPSDSAAAATEYGRRIGDLITLFREDAALVAGSDWLRDLHHKSLEEEAGGRPSSSRIALDQVVSLLNDGLLPAGINIERVTSEGVLTKDERGTVVPMRELSDGCRSVYAMVLDIVMRLIKAHGIDGLFEKRPSPVPEEEEREILVVTKPGIVLIDELESHLHPAWQRKLCGWLKSRFPRMQFLVTTHSPLVVQEATGTIHVLPLPGERREVRKLVGEERRKILLGDAEKVLLGAAFGLQDSRSEWAQRQLEKYSHLNAKKKALGRLPEPEEKSLARLKKDVNLAFDNHPYPLEPMDEASSG